MFSVDKLDSRRKFYYILCIYVMFAIVVYHYTFRKTIEAYLYHQELSIEASRSEVLHSQLNELLIHNKPIDLSVKESILTIEQSRSDLLKTISSYCRRNELKLVKFPPQHTAEKDGLTVSTSIVVVKGSFRESLGLLYFFERNEKNIKIRNVKFESLRVFQQKKIELHMTISMQFTFSSNKQ